MRKPQYTGKAYNSLDNINQFFAERGITPKQWPPSQPKAEAAREPVAAKTTPAALPQPIPRPAVAAPPPVPRQQSMFADMEEPVRIPKPAAAKPVPAEATRPPLARAENQRPPWEAPNLPNASFAPVVQRPVVRPVSAPPAPVSNIGSSQYAARQASAPRKSSIVGKSVRHAKYGSGVVLRQEGDGEDAKLTVSFPGFGLKKLVAKFAGIKIDG